MTSINYKPSLSKADQDSLRQNFTRKIAIHLRNVRTSKGLTQEELAFKAGINTAYYGHLERGVYSPTLFIIWRLAQALEMPIDSFLANFEAISS